MERNSVSGLCMHWLSKREVIVDDTPNPENKLNGKGWKQLKSEMVMCPAIECYVPLKKHIENLCHRNKDACPNGVGTWGEVVK